MVAVLKSSLMLEGSGSSLEDVTEGARRATVETSSRASPPDPEVAAIALRGVAGSLEGKYCEVARRRLASAERFRAQL
jgi:hypothetical protein